MQVTDEILEEVAKAICGAHGEAPMGAITDPRSGATVHNWVKYLGSARAAVYVIQRHFP